MSPVRAAALTGAICGWMLSLSPGALPRSAVVGALAGTVFALAGLAVGAVIGAIAPRPASRTRWIVLATVGLLALVAATAWQVHVRTTLGLPVFTWWPVATVIAPALAVTAVLRIPARVWLVTIGGVAVLASSLGVVSSPARANAPNVPDSALVDYSRIDGRDEDSRARELVQRWAADGGLDRRAVVVAVPTGSGWVDAAAVDGFARRFDGDVRVLALQYTAMPSWQAYLSSPASAGTSAVALLREVTAAMADVEPHRRPEVVAYGQSLGALGALDARAWARQHDVAVSTVLAGVPGGGPAGSEGVTIVNNATDPVARLTPSLLWRPPATESDESSDGPPWMPMISAIGTALDLTDSLSVPAGFGHRYGPEQAGGVLGQPSMGPRAAS